MSKPNIYITRKIPLETLERYQNQFHFTMWPEESLPVPPNVLLEESKKADGLICMLSDKIDASFLQHNSHLKIIANLAVGFDNIDVTEAEKHGIVVTNTPDVLTETTADLTFALLMATARRLVEANEVIRKDQWGDWAPFFLAGTDVHHKTIGIFGMGRIGEAVARRAKGFDMNILYHNRSRNDQAEKELGAKYVEFKELLTKSDYIVSLIPLTNETKYKFDSEAFALMKKSAYFINVSRGHVVDEDALYDALKHKNIMGAGLDVFQEEPIAANHRLLTLDNVVCLPHIGSASVETRTTMIELCLDNMVGQFYGNGAKTPVYTK